MAHLILLLLGALTTMAQAEEGYRPTFEEVDQRVVWAMSPAFMSALDQREANSSGQATCRGPGMLGSLWMHESIEAYASNWEEAYYIAGLRCIRKACNGAVQGHIVEFMDRGSVNGLLEQAMNGLYLSPEEKQAIRLALSTPGARETLKQHTMQSQCLEPNNVVMRNYVYMSCFIGMECGGPSSDTPFVGSPGGNSSSQSGSTGKKPTVRTGNND